MSKKLEGNHKKYIQLTRAWYGPDNLKAMIGISEQITFGFYLPDGSTSGSMTVSWENFDGELIPRLTVYNDAWKSLSKMHDLIDLMANFDSTNPTPKEFCSMLNRCGFEDKTETVNPSEVN